MELREKDKLVRFLQEELEIPASSIQLALNHSEQTPSLLPMILWQYGLVNLTQLNLMFDWMEQSLSAPDQESVNRY